MIKLFQDYQIQYRQKSARWVNVCCPYSHNHKGGDNKYFLGFDILKGGANCWSCGKLNLVQVIADLVGVSKSEAHGLIQSYDFKVNANWREKRQNATKLEIMGKTEPTKKHREYLEKRGYDVDFLSKKYNLRFTGANEVNPSSIVIPITLNFREVSYQCRTILDNQKVRYISATPEQSLVHFKDFVFGLDDWTGDSCGIVEGVFDMFTMGKGVGTAFGSALTNTQIKWLARRFKTVFFLFDSTDFRAWEKAGVHVRELKAMGINAERIRWDEEKDPAELGFEKCRIIKQELGLV